MVNGHASPFFQLGSGVRQGDPLSPSLFVIFLEPMLAYLRAMTGHLGIPINHDAETHHLSAFADDVTGFLSDIGDAPKFLQHVWVYAQAVGLQLNPTKTQLFRFHPSAPSTVSDSMIAQDTVSYLGVLQHSQPSSTRRFTSIMTSLQSRLALWRYRAHTLRG
uniref:Pol putative n=1 Tax=Albugo laibachii Nc14 TaxID=890382 RepID=F0W4Z2_9STRA|nr:Pol putative [Albugo laibachii Nc14]|eukprot:CCA16182.1 Pol putative [Albugo laibachii Nc14]